jgi:hypothetical protein
LENSEVLGQFVQIAVWILGAVLLIIKIVQSFRRSPPIDSAFRSIPDCTAYRTRNDAGNTKRDDESRESRARLYGLIEDIRSDMDDGLRHLGERLSSQEAKTEMINQRQVQMDHKIDVLLSRN